MMNAPKRIWVDTCKDADGEPEWDTGAWSLNQEQDDDKEYVRADLFAKAVEALRETAQMLSQCTFTNGQYFERRKVVDKANAALAELEVKK